MAKTPMTDDALPARLAAPQEAAIEALAAYAHEAWSGWMRYLFSQCVDCVETGADLLIPAVWAARWQRQMDTAYADLRDDEKASDRAEARRILAVAALLVGVEPPQTTRSVENSRLRNLAAELRAAGETTNRDVKRLEAFCEMVGGEPPAIAATFTAWHEDDGPVLWWEFPISEPPYAGTPLDSDWPFTEACYPSLGWTRLDIPQRKLDD